jgi:hypothetical protein
MLVDGGAAVNLMSYSVFKNLGREDGDVMKANLILNSVGAARWMPKASSPWSSLWGASHSLMLSSSLRCKVTIVSKYQKVSKY